MTCIDYDLEFLEDGRTIELISIGMVCDDGREYYAVNSDAPWERIRKDTWLMQNVWPHLPLRGHKRGLVTVGGTTESRLTEPGVIDMSDSRVKPHWVIANEVRDFIQATDAVEPQLWADYGAYDHVALCQLWGTMMRLPTGVPMWTHDLRQEIERLGVDPAELPQQREGVHDALGDARHNQTVRRWLVERAREAT
ncbi:3'-5' exoribonuclease [Streptomyces ipomoeae]|uniref:3'-5' exoribonuclease domain-containing protein n=1 Tax=Streptomyces ipomoeae TaxID=103232 RepID=UPI0029B38C71|nr:3'-5' exoribonuclease [Streptomyces ipomoeae]MDX2837971.1 3'-5' exoribonuclease [Streptomyces ipomoeae]